MKTLKPMVLAGGVLLGASMIAPEPAKAGFMCNTVDNLCKVAKYINTFAHTKCQEMKADICYKESIDDQSGAGEQLQRLRIFLQQQRERQS